MSEEHHDHDKVIEGIKKDWGEILEGSSQAVYIYLDDEHKICNEKFSKLLGYSSPQEWADVTESFPEIFVAEESQEHLVHTFQEAMENMTAAKVDITWKKKTGGEVDTSVIMVPIPYMG